MYLFDFFPVFQIIGKNWRKAEWEYSWHSFVKIKEVICKVYFAFRPICRNFAGK